MARKDTRFREAYNTLLDHLAMLAPGDDIPSEQALSDVAGVSRTIVRRSLGRLSDENIIVWEGRTKRLLRIPTDDDAMPLEDGRISQDELEAQFLEWVLHFDVPAETPLSVAELARRFNVPQHELKEFLSGLSRFGLVARRPQGGWKLRGFTKDFAVELSDFRCLLELHAVAVAAAAPTDHQIWPRLRQLRLDHVDLLDRIETDYHAFSKLDERFHETINTAVSNRFAREFQKVISLIFHYHFLWDKADEKERNTAAIGEHLAILNALEERDAEAAVAAMRRHLATSKTTLLASLRSHELG
ncbi:FCD domain-containing protein [Tropicibacter sp. S64]|uniref:GntR family transcriptional regulator n=1 Tax=Tropicibacter sp. S64 TaxID=3415122 RepID=UPI003C7A6156